MVDFHQYLFIYLSVFLYLLFFMFLIIYQFWFSFYGTNELPYISTTYCHLI